MQTDPHPSILPVCPLVPYHNLIGRYVGQPVDSKVSAILGEGSIRITYAEINSSSVLKKFSAVTWLFTFSVRSVHDTIRITGASRIHLMVRFGFFMGLFLIII